MVEQAMDTPADAVSARHATGVLPSQAIRGLIDDGVITADSPIGEDQIQPASIDLRLGTVAHRVQASFLPGTATVAEKLAQFGLHAFDITGGAVLECGCVYIVPLCESLRLERGLSAIANPKSSTGRLDIFTRLITDRGVEFDRVRGGYDGPLYAEISPRTFSVVVRAGARRGSRGGWGGSGPREAEGSWSGRRRRPPSRPGRRTRPRPGSCGAESGARGRPG